MTRGSLSYSILWVQSVTGQQVCVCYTVLLTTFNLCKCLRYLIAALGNIRWCGNNRVDGGREGEEEWEREEAGEDGR